MADAPPAPTPALAKGPQHLVIPMTAWLGTDGEPGLVDLPPDLRADALAELGLGKEWGPPPWTPEDERQWQLQKP